MKTLYLSLFITLLTFSPSLEAKTVELAQDLLSIDIPENFTELSNKEAANKFPAQQGPGLKAFGNPKRTTTIAYSAQPFPLPNQALAQTQESMAQGLEQIIPRVQWKEKKIIQLAGQNWIYLELSFSAVSGDIHNIILVTGHQDKTLYLSFNSTQEEFPQVKASLLKSLNSLQLKPTAKK